MSQYRQWRRFVERRRRELHSAYPCSTPTQRRWCPKHRVPVPQDKRIPEAWVEMADGSWRHIFGRTIRLSGICVLCRVEFYERLAAEYVNHREEKSMNTRPKSPTGDVLDQFELFQDPPDARKDELERPEDLVKAKEVIGDAA